MSQPPEDGTGTGPEVDPAAGVTTTPPSRVDRRRKRMSRWRRLLITIASAVVVVLLAIVLWYELEAHALGPEGRQVVVTVNTGESAGAVIDRLGQDGVIGSGLAFRLGDLVHGTPSILPGSYAFHKNQTFGEVRDILATGPNIFPVKVYDGLTLHEVANQVDILPGHADESFEHVAASGVVQSPFSAPGSNDLEGLLGTGTYLVVPGESDTTLLRAMVQRFDAHAAKAGLTATAAAALGMSPYQVVTVASIVEKEGYIPKNMPQVARVIYNRLTGNLPLQMDSTVLYALGQDGGAVTQKDLQIQSPYNTYLSKGLTPTPICSPSVGALTAAVHPPPGEWLYFTLVSKDGTEAFADTFTEQLANEKLAQSRGIG